MSRSQFDNNPVFLLCVVGIIIALVCLTSSCQLENDKTCINTWAADNSYTVNSIEKQYLQTGPFYYRGKNHTIYRVELTNKLEHRKVAWFRCGLWGFEQEWGE